MNGKLSNTPMPYIHPLSRKYFQIPLEILHSIHEPGQLNYLFTQLCLAYVELNEKSYRTYNDIMGALENCQFELYRRRISFYEDEKIKENGDVYL